MPRRHRIRSTRLGRRARLALIGAETLMGREIRDLVTAQGDDLRLIASEDEHAGALTEQAGEPAFVIELKPESLEDADVVFLTGSQDSARKALDAGAGATLIDLTYAAEDRADARLRAPVVEPPDQAPPQTRVHVIAHPAAIAGALFIGRIHERFPVRRWLIHVFEPASERGNRGIEELQQQTINLLSFKGLPKSVFDAQLAFNLLASYGEDAPFALGDAGLRIERHLATLLANSSRAPMPSLRLIQAPVFHGHSFSLWVEFERNPGVTALEQALLSEQVDVRGEELDAPTNVGMAGQSGVAVGAVTADRNLPQACWFWMAADNIRLAAENAVTVARQVSR